VFMHHGLAEWQTFLIDKPLPILMRTKLDVQDLIDQPQLSITQYVGPIIFDACFSASIFKHVNTQRVEAGRNPLTTLENALSHLGQSAFQSFLNQTPIFEELNLPPRSTQGYMRTMGQACHASQQAKRWGEQRNAAQFEEVLLAALLQNITELMLWCYADKTMLEIEHACYVEKQGYEPAANRVLGCGMRELAVALAENWNLPEMVEDGLRSKLDNFTLATGAALASELARVVDVNWYGKEAVNLIEKIAKYKGKKEGEVEHLLHLNSVNISPILLGKNFQSSARLLPQLADDNYIDPQFILQPEQQVKEVSNQKEETKKAKNVSLEAIKARAALIKRSIAEKKSESKTSEAVLAQKPRISAKSADSGVSKDDINKEQVAVKENTKPAISAELAKSIQLFKQLVSQGKQVHELIEHAVQTMLLCGVERCVFVVKLPNKKILVSRYVAQVSEDIAMRGLKIPVNTPHVFTLLMEKSRNVFINDNNRAKYWGLIPEQVKLIIGVKHFFAMSIFANNHAMGLMYADKVKGVLTDEEYTQFQAICRLLSKGIVESIKHKKPADG